MEDHLNEFEPQKKKIDKLSIIYDIVISIGMLTIAIRMFFKNMILSGIIFVVYGFFVTILFRRYKKDQLKKLRKTDEKNLGDRP